MPAPQTRYANSGDVNVAYQVLGEGPIDPAYVWGWITDVESHAGLRDTPWSSSARSRDRVEPARAFRNRRFRRLQGHSRFAVRRDTCQARPAQMTGAV